MLTHRGISNTVKQVPTVTQIFRLSILTISQNRRSENNKEVSIAIMVNRTARVQLINRTGQQMYNVTIIHKYSDDFTDTYNSNQGTIPNNGKSDEFTVRYKTGMGIIDGIHGGQDWWFAHWNSANARGGQYIFIDPDNKALFKIEKWVKDFAEAAATVLTTSVVSGPALMNPVFWTGSGSEIGTVAGNVTRKISESLIAGGVDGFYKHTLTPEDAHDLVTITIFSDGKVEIDSRSGVTETKYTVKDLKFVQGKMVMGNW